MRLNNSKHYSILELNEIEVVEFIDSALLYLFDNTFKISFEKVKEDEDEEDEDNEDEDKYPCMFNTFTSLPLLE